VQQFLDHFPFDQRVGLGGVVNGPSRKQDIGEDLTEDAYGCRFQYKGVGMPYCVHHPLAEAETVADVERHPWPAPEAVEVVSNARERAQVAREAGEFATQVGVETLFHRYHYLRGFDRWMLDVKLRPDLLRAIADRIHHINVTVVLKVLEQVGEYTDIVSTGDDFGHSTAPYMSPEDFGALVTPYYADLIGQIKSRWPHVRFYLHSHGQIMPLVGQLADCGVDILNPILPLDHMDPVSLKREFGGRLAFEGGIDIERILPFGTVDEVRDHVRRVIDILAPGGGYLFKLQAMSRLMPYENLVAAYELALDYGRYGR
ncbi:MAG: uroporphyrinogen decarboxylase family protein, partial [Planctomycetota bacterium]